MSANDAVPNPVKSVRKTAAVPKADVDLGVVVKKVSEKWADNEWLTLQWTTMGDFAENAQGYELALRSRTDTRSSRSQLTRKMDNLDKKIVEGLKYIKIYLTEKYKDDAKSYYPVFGITLENRGYVLPVDQDNRSEALRLLLTGLTAHGFGAKEYGTAFWTPIKIEYDTLLAQASNSDGSVSHMTGEKNQHKAYLKKAVNALVMVLKGNYPDTYDEELRLWGFQKEKY